MNSTNKSEFTHYPPCRRQSDRQRAITLTLQQVERDHAARMRRIVMVLGGAALLLLINGMLISTQF